MVARLLWEQDAGCSSHLTPTRKKGQFLKENCPFLFYSLFSFRFSLFSKIAISSEKIKENREKKR